MMKNKITTLKELRQEKARVKEELKLGKHGFRIATHHLRTRLKDKLIRQVLLPASLAGLAAWGVHELAPSENGEMAVHSDEKQQNGHLASVIVKVLDSLL